MCCGPSSGLDTGVTKHQTLAPKFNINNPEISGLISLFRAVGLSQSKTIEPVKIPNNVAGLKDIIISNDLVERSLDVKQLSLVSTLVVQSGKLNDNQKVYIVHPITDGCLNSSQQVNGRELN